MEKANPGDQILLMDLTKAFDTINRTMLWTTLCEKRAPDKPDFAHTTRAPEYTTQNKTTRTI